MSSTTAPSTTVSLYDAKTHLSELGERAAAGEEIIVTKHGKPRFKLVALEPKKRRPLPGSIDLGISVAERKSLAEIDWFERDEELEHLWGTRE
jgi:prevent-host-death family protein